MKSVKIECTPNEAGQCTNAKTIVSNADTGMPLGGVQKAVVTFDVKETNPKVQLDVVNLNRNFNATTDKINLNVVMFGDRYTYESELPSLSKEQLIEIIKYEAKLRYLAEHECASEAYFLRNKRDKEFSEMVAHFENIILMNMFSNTEYSHEYFLNKSIEVLNINSKLLGAINNAMKNLIDKKLITRVGFNVKLTESK